VRKHLKLVEVTGTAIWIKRSFGSPEVVGDDIEVITGISERLFACLIASSVAD
jgi:hypothetical protein